jgi:TrmH family RNA methyltransferase
MSKPSSVQSIASPDNPVLKHIRRLVRDPVAYRRVGAFWLEGEHLCQAWLAHAERADVAVVSDAAWSVPNIQQLALHAERVLRVSPALMAELSAMDSPPPLGFLLPWPGVGPQPAPLEGASAVAVRPGLDPSRPSLVLDRIQDAGNVGTLLRSAAAFGFDQILALKGCAGLWSPKVLRAGMGAHFSLRLFESLDLQDLDALKLPLLAASAHAEGSLPKSRLPWPCAWVMGHEGQGIAPALEARCDLQLRIPQPGGQESLNVAMAAAICLYESARQRGEAGLENHPVRS